jgi:hypothetical protein
MSERMTQRPPHDEAGIYSVLFVLLLGVFIMAGALAVDMGSLYFTRQATQSVADMAATAGGMELEPTDLEVQGNPRAACEAAWRYAVTNLRDVPDNAPGPCGAMPSAGVPCDPTTPNTVTGTTGPYSLAITWPVPDDFPPMLTHATDVIDGSPCQRIGVRIDRENDLLLAGFAGNNTSTVGADAVARAQAGQSAGDLVALVVLERHDCNALNTAGQGHVLVKAVQVPDASGTPVWVPGAMTIDSDGTGNCSNNSSQQNYYTLNSGGQGSTNIAQYIIAEGTVDGAAGVILSHAALVNPDTPNRGFRASHCGAYTTARDSTPVQPCPVGGNRVTRAPIDHRYNCKATYPGLDILGCPGAATNPGTNYIDQLRAHYLGFSNSAIPASGIFLGGGVSVYPDDYTGTLPSDPCLLNSAITITLDPGNWFINCPNTGGSGNTPGFRMSNNSARFTAGPGEIVFAGGLDLGGGFFTIGNSTGQSIVYVRPHPSNRGDLTQSGAEVDMQNTLVYLQDGVFALGGNNSPVTWSAPDDDAFPFDDLSLWAEYTTTGNNDEFVIGGQGNIDLDGTFFTPNARFVFAGQADNQQQRAQFVTRTLSLGGQGKLIMAPDPERSTAIPITGVTLIR